MTPPPSRPDFEVQALTVLLALLLILEILANVRGELRTDALDRRITTLEQHRAE